MSLLYKVNPRQYWILDSTLCISDSKYWILCSMSLERGFQIPIFNGIPDCL